MDVDAPQVKKSIASFALLPVGLVAVGGATLLMFLSGGYGWHRDELYFLAAAKRLAFGYADQPPLTPLLTKASVVLFGDTPSGVRVVAALAFAAIVVLAALICRELGGGRLAQGITAIATAVCGQMLAVGHMVSTSTFDAVFWLALALIGLRLLRTGNTKLWLLAGLVAGIGFQNKHLIALLAVSVVIGIVAVGPRSVLRTWWLPLGALIALAIAAPNLIWQHTHGWPQFTVASGISGDDGTANRILFVPSQLYYLSPFLVPVWLVGWWRLWTEEGMRWARSFAIAYPVAALAVLIAGGKGYYVAPLLVVLTAAGASFVADWVRRGRVVVRRVTFAVLALLAAASSAVMTLPVLPPDQLAIVNVVNPEQGEQIGWRELAETVARVYHEIPADIRLDVAIVASNYGEAGAIEHYGPDMGLPLPYSPHMGYAEWGPPPDDTSAVLIIHQAGEQRFQRHFLACRVVDRVDDGINVDNEEHLAIIAVCESPVQPWDRLWETLRRYY